MTETSTELIPRTTVSAIVAHRNAALAQLDEALATLGRGFELAEEAKRIAGQAHGAAVFHGADRTKLDAYRQLFQTFDPATSREAFRRHLDASTWMNIAELTGLKELMDKTAKDELYASLEGDVPEVCESTIYATLETLAGEAELIFQRGLARAFIELDKRFKSHDAFKLGSRVILTHVFDQWGCWNWRSRTEDTLADIERVFAVLDGERRPDTYRSVRAIRADRERGLHPHQSLTETEYFKIRGFKNGNAHLWFQRNDLVEKANKVLAAYYGEVLPDGVHREPVERTGALARDLAFYPTPPEAVPYALVDLYLKDQRVLEPSAGEGGLVFPALEAGAARVDAIEVNADRAQKLSRKGLLYRRGELAVTPANFLLLTPNPVFDVVLMNPPFCGTHWMEHVRHAFDFLRPGGVLRSILPATAEVGESAKHVRFREWATQHTRYTSFLEWRDLPAESFASSGTRINTVILTLYKSKA